MIPRISHGLQIHCNHAIGPHAPSAHIWATGVCTAVMFTQGDSWTHNV